MFNTAFVMAASVSLINLCQYASHDTAMRCKWLIAIETSCRQNDFYATVSIVFAFFFRYVQYAGPLVPVFM